MYGPATITAALFLIGLGAILTWAVNSEPEGLDINVVGVVLMLVGLAALLLSLLFWESWRPGYRRRAYADAAPAPTRRAVVVEEPPAATRRVDVVEEDVPPAGPPAPPPP